jgi:hypothetical protein
MNGDDATVRPFRLASQMGIDTHSTIGETPGASSLIPRPESVIHHISRRGIHIVIIHRPTNGCGFPRSPEPIFRQEGLKALSGGRHCRCCKAKRLVSAGLGNGAVIFPFVVSNVLISQAVSDWCRVSVLWLTKD